MSLFKKLKEKAQAIKENINFEELQEKASDIGELLQADNVDPLTKIKAAGSFVKDLGKMTKSVRSKESDCDDDDEPIDFSDLEGVSDEYKKRFEEEHGISYDEYMADVIENAGKPLDDETLDFLNNYGKD